MQKACVAVQPTWGENENAKLNEMILSNFEADAASRAFEIFRAKENASRKKGKRKNSESGKNKKKNSKSKIKKRLAQS